ncbi:MAG: MFS transporter [Candidatus Caldatribacteriaceae bacterium]
MVLSDTLRKSLELVVWGVCFGIVFFNITTGFPLAGFAKELGLGDLLYSVMLAMPVLGGTVQIVASLVLEKKRKRKQLFVVSGLVNRIPWLFIAFLPFLVHSRNLLFLLLVTFLTVGSFGGAFVNVSFLSWMGDLVPLPVRGRFFGHRTMVATIAALGSGLFIGKMLDTIQGISGFAFIFALASIAGITELLFFVRTYDPPMTTSSFGENPRAGFKALLHCRPFWRFLFFVISWNFAVNVASPFFNLYMLKYLHMNFFAIAFYVQVISNIATLFFVRVWGRLTDRFGNKPIASLTTLVATFLPIIWCLTTPRNWVVVIPIIQTLAGIFWPGIDLTTNNLLLKLSPAENRSLYVGVLNFFLGLFGTALAYLVGGYVLEWVVPLITPFLRSLWGWPMVPYYSVFLLSSCLRLVSFTVFLPRIEEGGACTLRGVAREILARARRRRP